MAISPEREKLPIDERLEEFPEPEVPIEVEHKQALTPTVSQFKAQVFDDQGRPMIQTPGGAGQTVIIPADVDKLTMFSKGSPDEALTWFGAIWKRMFKKAIHFGLKVITGGES